MPSSSIARPESPEPIDLRTAELERRLLEVYPEARALLDTIARHDRFHEIWLSDEPHIELQMHEDQVGNPGPFWTIVAQGSCHDTFRVISISLDPEHRSMTWRRRDGPVGQGDTIEGADLVERILDDRFANASLMYEFWFVEDRINRG